MNRQTKIANQGETLLIAYLKLVPYCCLGGEHLYLLFIIKVLRMLPAVPAVLVQRQLFISAGKILAMTPCV